MRNISMQEIFGLRRAKLKYAHPDGTQGSGERIVKEDRTKRLNLAYAAIQQARE